MTVGRAAAAGVEPARRGVFAKLVDRRHGVTKGQRGKLVALSGW